MRGQYSVAASTTDFTVSGKSDVDGDGSQANYSATTSVNATLTTANTIY